MRITMKMKINSHKILITAVVITRLISVVMKLLIVRISGVRMRQKFLLELLTPC